MYCFALQCFSVRRGDVEKKAFKWTGPPVGNWVVSSSIPLFHYD